MNNRPDIVVYGTLNMDLVNFVDHLPQNGETVTSKHYGTWPGGKASNQAVGASRLGANVAMVGCVGSDSYGEQLKCNLTENRVNIESVCVSEEHGTGTATITVDKKGQNTIVTNLGANYHLIKKDVDHSLEKLSQSKLVLLQLEMLQEVGEYIIYNASKLHKKIVLNLAPVNPINDDYLRMVDLLIVNETEASQLTNIDVNSIEDAKNAVEKLFRKGIRNIIVTLGENGALLKKNTLLKHFPSPLVNTIDTTAAGDCFVAATAWFWLQEDTLDIAVKRAVEVASLSTTKKGSQASLPTMSEFLKYKETLHL